jgi:hypothetical protein
MAVRGLGFAKRKNQKGLAMIETLPILVIFLVLIAFSLGFFGIVHTGILNSIAARAYAFETFRNRADLSYFRDKGDPTQGAPKLYFNKGFRFHTINDENRAGDVGPYATARPLAIGREIQSSGASVQDHNVEIFSISGRNRTGGVEASPAWVMVGYGICVRAACGQ